MQGLPEKSFPEPCSHCQICQWKDRCSEEWKQKDHLSLVANIRRSQADKLRKQGIQTVADLSRTPKNCKVKGINKEAFSRLQSQAFLQTKKAQTGQDKYQIIPFLEDKGFFRLPKPNEGDLFFDIEGDPLFPNGLEYLFGVYCPLKEKPFLKQFWAHSHSEEKEAFKTFMNFLEKHLHSYPEASIYHYNHYEPTALKRLACRHALKEEFLDNLLRKQKFVDLYLIVKESLRISEPGYSLKNMETFYGNKRRDSVSKAIDSIVIYNKWRETDNSYLLQEIAAYNETDCISTAKLRDWLLTLKPPDIPWFINPSNKSSDNAPERKEWEKEYEEYQKLLGQIKENKEFNDRVSSLLEFHNRETKVQWWNCFERQNKEIEDLIEDMDCLADLHLIEPPKKEGNDLIYNYKFPPQEHRLKTGDTVTNIFTLKNAGTLLYLNDSDCTARIKYRANKEKLPERFSAGPSNPIDRNLLRSAIYRFASSVIKNDGDYQCVKDLLNRSIPRRIDQQKEFSLKDLVDLKTEALNAVSKLNKSYLFIQGPPGAGKTYISSYIILELIKQRKKIGVTSNSHKAIHNLLKHIEQTAIKENVSFHGVKKASQNREDTVFNGHFIENKFHTKDIPLGVDLWAGTAWLFSQERLNNHLDYLFIDEAGQIALANAVAMGLAAKNMILIGDQMQLSQPIQGIHPDDAGLSVLEFLLGEETVISKERGLFLNKSYRMNQNLCHFISSAFYKGRLKTHKSTNERKLTLKENSFPNEGIVLISTNHEGCSQKSSKEGQIIKEQYSKLLQGQFSQGQNTRPLNEEDILVVAPYNAQVNYLKSLLPKKARVGTIDKFQGQEAPVVLVSMTTSSGEEVPRNMEFLFSQNRLNVALSRAQCLAIIIVNAKLFEMNCKTIEQMKLLNTFCHLKEYALSLDSL